MRELTLYPANSSEAFSSFAERLAFAKSRVDALEQRRIQRVLNCCNERFHRVFSLLPMLIHYNLPTLPAYVENAPSGIVGFTFRPFQAEYISEFSLYNQSVSDDAAVFDGLYAMGSIGSITQTRFSDLDLWLCHSGEFSAEQHALIQQKLTLIKQWAKEQGVEISLFLMNPAKFRYQLQQGDASDEHNGSAQHFFLLDEFYRSAIRLAGKRILWLHLEKQGRDYPKQVQQAVENGELNAKEWIDFGDFASLSTDEFFGASLWQLYKGINSPHKSLIKILLLESYAETYPKTDLISKKFKKLLLSNCGVVYHFDPYLAMLEQVTCYLEQRQEFARLDCLRRCFYLKANQAEVSNCRQKELNRLTESWQWQESELAELNDKPNWKVKQVAAHQQMIVEQLLQSYRHLLDFARKYQLDPSIMPQDTDFLMRQLYSAFENVPSKIELINKCGGYDLAEADLTFIEVSAGVSIDEGWYMINHSPFATYDSTKRYVRHSHSLIELIAWAYFNGLITANTQIHLVNQQRINLVKLRQFITDLRLSFPVRPPKIGRDDLNHRSEVRNLIVAVNLVEDPTRQLEADKASFDQFDPFNLGSSNEGVIGSISIIYRNMWNEVFTQHFEGSETLLQSLKFISNKIYRSSAPPESVSVFSYSQQMSSELRQFVLNLVNRCITVKTGSIFQRVQPQVVQLAGKKWHLVFNKRSELKEIVQEIEPKAEQAVPNAIYAFASEGFVQFFFEDNPDGSFNVYVLDKQNKTESYYHCQGSKEQKIKEISRLYTEDVRSDEAGSFNFPQFYQLLPAEQAVTIVPFQSKQHREFLDKQRIKDNLCQSQTLN